MVVFQVETVVTSSELLPKFSSILSDGDRVKRIVYFEWPVRQADRAGLRPGLQLTSYWDCLSLGRKTANNNLCEVEPQPPTADTPAIIMYTRQRFINSQARFCWTKQQGLHRCDDYRCKYLTDKRLHRTAQGRHPHPRQPRVHPHQVKDGLTADTA